MVSFLNGISTFMGYLMPNSSWEKKSRDTTYPIRGFRGKKREFMNVDSIAVLSFQPSRMGKRNTPIASLQMLRSPNEYPVYNTKQSDDEATVMLELWEMQSTPLLPSLPGPFWPGGVATYRVLSIGKIEL